MKWPFARHGGAPDSVEHDIDEELSFHLSKTIDELRAGGMSDTEARAAAARRFGSLQFHRHNLLRLERQARSRANVSQVVGPCRTRRGSERARRRNARVPLRCHLRQPG